MEFPASDTGAGEASVLGGLIEGFVDPLEGDVRQQGSHPSEMEVVDGL